MYDICIRTLRPNELHLLMGLFEYNDCNEMIQNNTNAINACSIDIFGLFLNGALLGELRVMYDNVDEKFANKGRRAYLYAFRIHKNFQGMGHGKQLLKYVINQLTDKGYSEFTVGVEDDNERAKHIYQNFGFNEIISRIQEEYQGEKYEYNLYLKVSKQ